MSDRKPAWHDGVPCCTEDECPSYDGKRCGEIGFKPDRICEPEVKDLVARLAAYDVSTPLVTDAERECYEAFKDRIDPSVKIAVEAIERVAGQLGPGIPRTAVAAIVRRHMLYGVRLGHAREVKA